MLRFCVTRVLAYRRWFIVWLPEREFDLPAHCEDEPSLADFSVHSFVNDAPEGKLARSWATLIAQTVSRLLPAFGVGYRDTTCESLFCAELEAESIKFAFPSLVQISAYGEHLREVTLKCIALDRRVVVSILAWREQITAADRAIHQTYLKHLGAQWGVIINFGKRQLSW